MKMFPGTTIENLSMFASGQVPHTKQSFNNAMAEVVHRLLETLYPHMARVAESMIN